MRRPSPCAWPPGTRHALLVVALALVGLLSMHGWGTHAAVHPNATAAGHAHAAMVAAHPGSHGHDTAALGKSSRPGSTHQGYRVDAEGGEHPSGEVLLLGLCLAVLGGLLFCIALLLRRRLWTPRMSLSAWPLPVFLSRDRDPPDLLRLCVTRC